MISSKKLETINNTRGRKCQRGQSKSWE